MDDSKKTCLGFGFLIAAIVIAVLAILGGGIGSFVNWIGGDAFGINLKTGAILGIGAFAFFFVISLYLFVTIKNWAWLPVIFSTVYAVLPDIILGPEDDAVVLVIGALISGFLAYRRGLMPELEDISK